jgi:RNA polymerase-binding transcription factor DksA
MDTSTYKKLLEAELSKVERELTTVGRKNPANPNDWQATPAIMDVDKAEENETAEAIEEFEDHTAILKQLEIRFNEIREALSHIEKGTFGLCSVCKNPVEADRLHANPAATTCKAHMSK